MYGQVVRYAQSLIAADGIRQVQGLTESTRQWLWIATLLVGVMVFMPSQMSIVDDVSRRWTDIICSSNAGIRNRLKPHQASRFYYAILVATWRGLFSPLRSFSCSETLRD